MPGIIAVKDCTFITMPSKDGPHFPRLRPSSELREWYNHLAFYHSSQLSGTVQRHREAHPCGTGLDRQHPKGHARRLLYNGLSTFGFGLMCLPGVTVMCVVECAPSKVSAGADLSNLLRQTLYLSRRIIDGLSLMISCSNFNGFLFRTIASRSYEQRR
jgi:hypothetical protein